MCENNRNRQNLVLVGPANVGLTYPDGIGNIRIKLDNWTSLIYLQFQSFAQNT
jgi:hypothetical protein